MTKIAALIAALVLALSACSSEPSYESTSDIATVLGCENAKPVDGIIECAGVNVIDWQGAPRGYKGELLNSYAQTFGWVSVDYGDYTVVGPAPAMKKADAALRGGE